MNFTEIMVGSVVLLGSFSVGIQVFGQAANSVRIGLHQERQLAIADVQLLASQRFLTAAVDGQVGLLNSDGDCRFDLAAVQTAIQKALPLPEGVQRHWQPDSAGSGLWLELVVSSADAAQSSALRRRQLITPAGTGWCRFSLEQEP